MIIQQLKSSNWVSVESATWGFGFTLQLVADAYILIRMRSTLKQFFFLFPLIFEYILIVTMKILNSNSPKNLGVNWQLLS